MMNLCPIFQNSITHPSSTAIISDSFSLTYSQLEDDIELMIGFLLYKGVRAGSVVVYEPELDYFSFLLLWSLLRVGAIVFPLNGSFKQKQIQEYCLLVNFNFYFDSKKIRFDYQNFKETPVQLLPFTISFHLNFDKVSFYLLTSGSTGVPKIVVHSLRAFFNSAYSVSSMIMIGNNSRYLFNLPLFHVAGLGIIFRSLINVSAIVFSVIKELEFSLLKFNITHISLVHTQLYRLINSGFYKKRNSLVAVVCGGSSFPLSLIKDALKTKIPLFMTYGMTETASQVSSIALNQSLIEHSFLISGTVLNHAQIKIDSKGQILVKSDSLFKGYLKNGFIISNKDIDGWYSTGDVGFLQDGMLTVTGRLDNMFVSGGECVYPEEIEKCLLSFPEVKYVIVVPIVSKLYGHSPVAFVELSDKTYLLKTLSLKVKKSLPSYKCPIHYYKWPKNVAFEPKENRRYFKKYVL